MTAENDLYQADLDQTLANRERLRSNRNLMHWYGQLYRQQFLAEPEIEKKRILEIGSGSSPLKLFIPNVTTSDVLNLHYLDIVFDCHNIADQPDIPDGGFDIITMTNVLHHLRDPLAFLKAASRKLAKGGRLYIVEPYFSVLSYPLYKFLHHESSDFSIDRPVLQSVSGPLSSSNQAMPHMIFFSRPDWFAELAGFYDLPKTRFSFFTGLSYALSGGISRKIPLPLWLYATAFAVDHAVAQCAPKLSASFFMATLVVAK